MSNTNVEPSLPRYMTEQEVSALTGFSLAKLRSDRFYQVGIPYRKVGRLVRYLYQEVIDYMESGKIETFN